VSEPWESRDYQTIEAVGFDGQLHVRFANGDEATLSVDRILKHPPEGLDWAAAESHAQELLVPSTEGAVDISWMTLRAETDPRFAEFLVEEADDEARRIGQRLRALRERRGMSSKEVAEAAGIAPMSLSRIELGRHDVVFRTLRRILAAMGYTLKDLADMAEPALETATVLSALKNAGVTSCVIEYLRRGLSDDAHRIADAARRIFDIAPDQLVGGRPQLSPALAQVRFKSAINQNPALATYTLWAHWLALLVDQACPREPADIPENPFAVRQEVLARYGAMRFEHLLDWCWEHDVAVLPLQDPGEFHGACWNVDGRVVIVLKQLTPSGSRWTFDLGHELGHVARHLDARTPAVIELGELKPAGSNDDDDEQEASDFAGELVLGNPDALARELAERTDHKLPRLKAEVMRLAQARDVEVDALANYMAYRLAAEGQDWWATASRLQDAEGHAPDRARDALLAHIDWDRLSDDDASLLLAALDWEEAHA